MTLENDLRKAYAFSEISVGTKFVMFPEKPDSVVYTKTEKGEGTIGVYGHVPHATYEWNGKTETAYFVENSDALVKIIKLPEKEKK